MARLPRLVILDHSIINKFKLEKAMYKRLIVFLLIFSLSGIAGAAHIGKVKIKRIRNTSSTHVVVWLDRIINNPPACATVLNKIVINDTNTDWGKQKLSMLMTAMVTGYAVDSNCTTSCKSNWDGEITICTEVSIEK